MPNLADFLTALSPHKTDMPKPEEALRGRD